MADPFMVVGFLFTVLAWALWMVSIAKFPLTYAYPFMGLNFVGLMVLGYLVLGEPITSTTLMGTLLITVGVGVIAQG
jgi:drug/metabolite transporter (DMT)-like permease